ncbi:MAG: endonuclease/exonuclease/phosphatase family protein [Sulfurovaceae bacterium]|nr:endonuclease/exonuclease/phosphatase family protein [Sulfurovaceae bacterium]
MKNIFFLFYLPLNLLAIEFKIASYNVENLFDMHHNKTEYPQYIPYKHNWTDKILSQKLKNISEVICELDADIIGLQEIENQNVLALLQKSLKKYGCNYKYRAITSKKRTAIQVALLSKIPIKSHQDIVVKKVGGIRNILEVKFMIEKRPLYIFVNHWNSKRSPESKRILSALALKKRVLNLPKRSEYILLGDFNSNYNEYKVVGKTGINSVLNSMSFRESSMRKNNFRHYNLWLELLPYQRWSHNFYGNRQGLDAILLPATLFDTNDIDYKDNSFGVFKRDYLFTKKGYVNRWQYKKKHIGKGYSDHFPVFAIFSTVPYQFKKENQKIENCSILNLIQKETTLPCHLKRVKVVSTRKRAVKIEDKSANIVVYGVGKHIKKDKIYSMDVYQTKIYKGEHEIIDFSMSLLEK